MAPGWVGGWVAPGWVGGWVAPGWVGGWVGGARVGGARVGGWVGGARVDGWRPGGWVGGWSPGGWVAPGWLCRWVAPGWVGGWVAPGLDQIGLKPEGAQKHSFSAFWLFGPSWAEAQMCPKTIAFGIPVPKNIRIRHSRYSYQLGLKPEGAQKHSFSAFRLIGPNWAEAGTCPRAFVFGILAVRWVASGWVGWWVAPGWMGGARVGGWVGGAWVGGWVGGARVRGWRPGGLVGGWRPGGWVAPGWVGGWVQPGWMGGARVRGWVGGWRPGGWVGGWRPGGWVGGWGPGGWVAPGWVGGWVGGARFRPNWPEARMCPKTFLFGVLAVRTKLTRNPNVPKNICIRHSGYSDQVGLKPECAQKHSYSAFLLFRPNWAEARTCPKIFVFGILAIRTKLG